MKCCWHTAWGTSGERVQEVERTADATMRLPAVLMPDASACADTFRFKGSPEAFSMVNVSTAALAARRWVVAVPQQQLSGRSLPPAPPPRPGQNHEEGGAPCL